MLTWTVDKTVQACCQGEMIQASGWGILNADIVLKTKEYEKYVKAEVL